MRGNRRKYTTRLGTDGGTERVILVTGNRGFYLAVRIFGRYHRVAVWRAGRAWYVGRQGSFERRWGRL